MSRKKLEPLCSTKDLAEAGVTRIVMPKGSFAGPDGSAQYRLLDKRDAICPGDEVLCEDCETWCVMAEDFMGVRYDGNLFVPMRRPLQPNKVISP